MAVYVGYWPHTAVRDALDKREDMVIVGVKMRPGQSIAYVFEQLERKNIHAAWAYIPRNDTLAQIPTRPGDLDRLFPDDVLYHTLETRETGFRGRDGTPFPFRDERNSAYPDIYITEEQ